MKNYVVLIAALLASSQAWSETWRCTDMTTYHSYISSQNVPSDRCEKTSDADPADAERGRMVPNAEQSESDRVVAAIQERREAREAEERKKEMADELVAAEHATVTCKSKATCNKAFALAQIYVQQHSDQKIQVATDTIIDTYNPTEGGNVGITVTKVPRAGATEVISITPHCKTEGMYYESVCRLKRTSVYRGFRPFVKKSLAM